ncbi:MAG: hypothetical protein ABWZ93_08710 [Xanthobacteraceae bacterium]
MTDGRERHFGRRTHPADHNQWRHRRCVFSRPAAFVLGEEAIMLAPPERFLLMRGL